MVSRNLESSRTRTLGVEIGRVQGVPGEFLASHGHLVAIVRKHGELVGKVIGW